MYFVYKPHFRPIGTSWFRVEMELVKELKAETAAAALAEARRLGYIAPIVGKEEEETEA